MNPLILPLFIFGINEIAAMSSQQEERNQKYELARAYAKHLDKPLLVVGGPYGNIGFRHAFGLPAHPCGDVCCDLAPSACEDCPRYVQADVRNIPYPDKYFGAAFVSHVLEHLPTAENCIAAVNELNRVADIVLVAYPTPSSMIACLIPDHYLWLHQEGNTLYIKERC